MKLKDQTNSIAMINSDPALTALTKVQAPLIDLEVRGVPALGYFGSVVWRDVYDRMNAGESMQCAMSSAYMYAS